MPLPDRIKELIAEEKEILKDTIELESNRNQKRRINQETKQALTHSQIKNRDETTISIQQLTHHLQTSPEKNPGPTSGQEKDEKLKQQRQLLTEVQKLLKSAYNLQNQAVTHLNQSNFAAAIPEEKKSIEALKKALDKLTQDPQQNQKRQKEQAKKPQSGDSQQKQAKKSNKNSANDKSRPQGQQSKDNKRLTPKAALKELAKLRKKAKEEKKRRERAYGKIAIPNKAPVEKDW